MNELNGIVRLTSSEHTARRMASSIDKYGKGVNRCNFTLAFIYQLLDRAHCDEWSDYGRG